MVHYRARWRILVALLACLAITATACRTEVTASSSAATGTAAPTVAPVVANTTVPPAPPTTSAPTVAPTPLPAPTVAPTPPPTPTPKPTPTPAPAALSELLALSSLEPVTCPDDVRADRVSCSVATVPRDVDTPQADETVELMVALVDNGDPSGVGPVVFLQGGPGVGSVQRAPNFVGASHDVLFVDQRGTGYSSPKLSCPEVDDLWEAEVSDDPEVRVPEDAGWVEAAYAQCAERLRAEGIDFDDFNTKTAAVDIALLRQLFGYDEWVLWGISYGTRLGLTVMRDHPEGIRAAVLDSVLPFEVDFFATIPEHHLRAIRALDAACDIDRCADDHGDFFDNLATLVRQLDDDPAVITVTRPGTGAQFPFRVDGAVLLNLVFIELYGTRTLRALPRQIARAEFGGLEEMAAAYVTGRDPTQFDLSVGLYYSTWCREEFPFYDESYDDDLLVALEADFGTAADALSSDGIGIYCDDFAVTPSGPIDDQELSSDIPTLVFAGAFDPITPPAWSRQVADQLTNAVYVELADHGHGMATSCPATIRLAFLIDPNAVLDTTCAADTGGPDFE